MSDLPRWFVDNKIPTELAESSLFKFMFSAQGTQPFEVDMIQDVDIDFENLESTLEKLPAQYIYWASIYSELKNQCTVLDMRIARRRAYLAKMTAERYRAAGVRMTDKQMQAIVEADEVDVTGIDSQVRREMYGATDQEIKARIEKIVAEERKKTLVHLEAHLAIANRNAGKAYHMVQAIQMRSEHCRSLAGFKRQEKVQACQLT